MTKRKPPVIQPLSLRHPKSTWVGKLIDWFNEPTYNWLRKPFHGTGSKLPLLKGRFSFKLRWEHLVIAFLLGLVLAGHSQPHILRASMPAQTPEALITLPKVKDVSYAVQTPLEQVWVSKLRPAGTYANGFAPLNCTFGVASRLPVTWTGDAYMWAANAAAQGYTVSSVPKVEAIAQTSGDSYWGHVGIVTAINPDGSFVIWEENGLYGLGTMDERTTTTAEFPNFIYL